MLNQNPISFVENSMAAMPEGEVFTVMEVADFLKVTPVTVRTMLRQGQLQGFRVRKEWRVTREQLQAFMDQQSSQHT
jgi:excisionase family DNA binding protein